MPYNIELWILIDNYWLYNAGFWELIDNYWLYNAGFWKLIDDDYRRRATSIKSHKIYRNPLASALELCDQASEK